ncbi:Solute carrier family 25 member 51 [Echinococcus granulosus]|uniref:Mitochondrial carrier triple repeat protein n=1 Tax=Echinococcus granulosus TaxID=6210 RepID=A0A068WM65_ECHGR|nr:Solute carrier family 25 member 51 [Echinococcus granulosus]CDS18728.1 mitochondrial carrier triple repeat protein [Echinococcus granulosus]
MPGLALQKGDGNVTSLITDEESGLLIPREYICGGIASMINVVVVFPLHKTVFFQQLEGIKWSEAFMRLRREGLWQVYRGVVPPLLQRASSASVMFGFQSQSQRFLYRHQGRMDIPLYIQTILSATMAGCLEASLTPFERVQTLLQSSNKSRMYKNTPYALSSLYKSYGFRELYRGFTPILLRNCIGDILYFSGKEWLRGKSHSEDLPFGKRRLTDFVIGGFLGSTIGAAIFPLNVVKTQMQSTGNHLVHSLVINVVLGCNVRMSFPLVVKEFFIFTAQNKEAFGSEYGKVLYFYPSGTSQNDQLAVVGLCDALLSFSNFFLTSCTALHTRNGKRYFHRISDDVWGVLSVSVIDPSALSHVCKFCERIIDDNVISHKLANLCERFELLHGPILIGSEAEMVESRSNLMKFFSKELTMIDLSFHDIPDLFEAIQGKFWSPKNILSLENLGTRIQLSCPFPNTSAVLLYDAHLAWSSLSVKDFRPILRYIISEIMSLPPDLDLAAISPKAPHMGRFLTGPPDMDKRLCPAQTLIPTVFLKLPNSEYRRVNVVVYRALRLTFCLFVDEKYALKKEFFTTFDTMYGNALTDLSTEIEGDYGESAAFTSDISTLSLSTESSSKPIQGTPGCSSIGGFLLWEPELASITTDLFPLYSGGLSDVIPAFAPLLPIIYAVRGDVMSCFGQSWCECLVKLEPDIWLHLRRLNKREIFLTFFGKKVDISKVISESKRFWVEKLSDLFQVN